MHRLLPALGAVAFVAAAVAFSRQSPTSFPDPSPALKIASEARNPWTHLKVNNDPDQFQFAVLSDRTGGHREKVFSRAVRQINLLQPEFVMSVGDLIEGYTKNDERIAAEWREFQTYASKFEMPFFYVPGNHDLANKTMAENWGNRFGRAYYHFVYKDVLFLAVNSEDPHTKQISPDQLAYFKKALAENAGAKWTLVFLHQPLWVGDAEKSGWKAFEDLLAGRKYTVFCGHVHQYHKYVRNGMNYYQLATTGGGSKMRGVKFGEFDHVVWVTMKADGPVLANVLLDGVLPDDLSPTPSDEPGAVRKLERTHPTTVTVYADGSPCVGATVRLFRETPAKKWEGVADGVTEGDGAAALSTFNPFDGVPAGEYAVTVTQTGKYRELGDPTPAKNTLPEKYAAPKTTPLKVTVKADEKNALVLELTR